MLERRRLPYGSTKSIDLVDKALINGDPELAESILSDALKATYTTDPDAYHHLSLRAAGLPLYELVGANPTNVEMEEASQTTYAWLMSFIENELGSPDYYSSDIEVRERRKGRLSEDVGYSFLIRKFLRQGNKIPLPATSFEDRIHKIDFLLVPLAGLDETGKNIQMKTRSPRLIVDSVIYMSMDQLDPAFISHDAEESLTRCMIREAAGIAEPHEIEKLHDADRRLDAILA